METNESTVEPKQTSRFSMNLVSAYIQNMTNDNSFNNRFIENEHNEMETLATSASQKFFVMRHGERIDMTFGSWVSYCFDGSGNYKRKDLNMPLTLPKRKLGAAGYLTDSPLTQIGVHQSVLIGEGLRDANINIEHVYCSPSYRCVQTCDGVLRGLGKKDEIKIKVEPNLFEWLEWYNQVLPDWFTVDELIDAGYNIDGNYTSHISRQDLTKNKETFEDFSSRYSNFFKRTLASHPTGNILCVGHAVTLKACMGELMRNTELGFDEMMKGIKTISYASLLTLSKNEDKWDIIKLPCFSVTHTNNSRFISDVLI